MLFHVITDCFCFIKNTSVKYKYFPGDYYPSEPQETMEESGGSRFECFFMDFSDFWFKMYFLLTHKCRIPRYDPYLASYHPSTPLPQWALHLATRTESGVKKGRCECSFSCYFCCVCESVCECVYGCVCVYFLCTSALSYANKSATPRHMSHLSVGRGVGQGARGPSRGRFEMGVTEGWRLAAVRKNISHTICHTRYILCALWQQKVGRD